MYFIDASEAFYGINYEKMFTKMVERGVPVCIFVCRPNYWPTLTVAPSSINLCSGDTGTVVSIFYIIYAIFMFFIIYLLGSVSLNVYVSVVVFVLPMDLEPEIRMQEIYLWLLGSPTFFEYFIFI